MMEHRPNLRHKGLVFSAKCTEPKKIWPKRVLYIDQPKEYPDIPARITTNREFDEALLPAKRR